MKKNYFMTTLLLLSAFWGSNAQVVNGNFETVKPNFLVSNWGMNFIQPVSIDIASGQSTSDNVQFTWCVPSMVYATTDAYSGQYAMEVSNAFNQTQNIVIPGQAMIFSDAEQDFPGWNAGVPVNAGANIERLGFYYKFLAVGNDVAQASMVLIDADGNEIGRTSIDLQGTDNQFRYIYSYIYHPYNVAPAQMFITFDMQKPGSVANFGSRLIIDNVVANPQALEIIETSTLNEDFRVSPTLADQEINIIPSSLAQGAINYRIINAQGRLVKENTESTSSSYVYTMDVSNLQSGVYILEIESNVGKTIKKFVKK